MHSVALLHYLYTADRPNVVVNSVAVSFSLYHVHLLSSITNAKAFECSCFVVAVYANIFSIVINRSYVKKKNSVYSFTILFNRFFSANMKIITISAIAEYVIQERCSLSHRCQHYRFRA